MILTLLLFQGVISEIVYFIEVCRHGARTPSDFMEWDVGRWTNGSMLLTPEGMRQQYLIGAHLRERYIIDNKLLPDIYNSSLLYVVSTSTERAQSSIQSQLKGLYPYKDHKYLINPIPPISLSESFDVKNAVPITSFVINSYLKDPMFHSKDECPEYENYIKMRKNSLIIKQIFEKYRYIVRIIENTYNISKDEAENLILDVIASIRSNKFHEHSWHPAFDDIFIEIAQQLYMEAKIYSSYSPDDIARFAGSDFFNNITKQIKDVRDGKMIRKASIYSAHDTTIYSIFATLGMMLTEQPPFGTTVLFEVLKENGEFFVRLLYNMEERIMPGCFSPKCPVDIFLDHIHHRVFTDTKEACKSIPSIDKSHEEVADYILQTNQINLLYSAVCVAELILFGYLINKKYSK